MRAIAMAILSFALLFHADSMEHVTKEQLDLAALFITATIALIILGL